MQIQLQLAQGEPAGTERPAVGPPTPARPGVRRPARAVPLHPLATEVSDRIGASTLLAAWNAAVYVAQIEGARMTATTPYLDVTGAARRRGGLWRKDELFVIARHA